ncbi:hypothetical protein ELI25_29525 (plasmid) [Rhizobium ruizarguesonis]|uniref:hypothetical protein n=1 Tax=Rhizobium ruizarguesonis TaxID=2081791 RepID=UPI0010308650|nr:hypothetical protein [Rhizobium ruizarguesonis]TAW06612.1 hypothetical protein ELI25_29525 [Rhizobium ruizarguesonis]
MRLLILSIGLLYATLAHAQFVLPIGGSILIDKAGDEVRDSIDHAKEAAGALLDHADELAKQRLIQIDEIINRTGNALIGKTEVAALSILAQTRLDIDNVRAAALNDLRAVIWEAECAGRRLTLSDLDEALGGFGDLLGTHQIRLSLPISAPEPWYCTSWWCDRPDVVEIKEPFGDTFIEIRNRVEDSISNENVTEGTAAHRIVGSYEYLSAFALKTSCFYPGSSEVWNREYLKYRERARKWRTAAVIRVE